MNLQEHFTKTLEPKTTIKKLIGWFSYGGNNRVKHYYIVDSKHHSPVSICGQGYSIINITDKAKKRINQNPNARVHKKCKTCRRKILGGQFK
ncbi:MAG: hypothetical protein ACTSW1_07600 [Candidatus Hodarchaeales archaeon]